VREVLEALAEECAGVSETVLGLPEADFARPTRCSEWNVKELLGHMHRDVRRVNDFLGEPEPPRAEGDSVSYWRSYDRVAEAPGIAERGKEVAGAFATGSDLAEDWDRMWRDTIDAVEAQDPGRVVQAAGPAMGLEEYMRTRVLEVCVHRMDLEDAFGRRSWGSDGAVSIVDDILVGLLGKEPPHDLDWDVVEFIEIGTGRRPLREDEVKILGKLASRFPLIG
jgi:uncharacterized protein (TIGR03083 family)